LLEDVSEDVVPKAGGAFEGDDEGSDLGAKLFEERSGFVAVGTEMVKEEFELFFGLRGVHIWDFRIFN